MRRIVALMASIACIWLVRAEEFRTVTCYELEGLEKILPKEELRTITHLKLIGNINDVDLRYVDEAIRTWNVMKALDIEETGMTIISGYFNDCRSLEEVRLPRKCIAVNNSFQSSSIKKMEFGQVRDIYYSFRSFPQLKSISEISANYIHGSFIDCSVIDSITISNQVTEIYGYSFQNCPSLRYLRLPDRLEKIGVRAFLDCNSLEEIVILSRKVPTLETKGNELPSFGDYTRRHCVLYVPFGYRREYSKAWPFDRVVEVDDSSPIDTTRLNVEYTDIHVDTPGKLSSLLTSESLIQSKGFRVTGSLNKADLTVLNNLSMRASLQALDLRGCRIEGDSIPSSVFYGSGIVEIYLPEDITKIGYQAFCLSSLKRLVVPADNRIESIGEDAFGVCTQLLSPIHFPRVTEIGAYAFNHCTALTEVSFPMVKRLGAACFHNCWQLIKVSLGGKESVGNRLVIPASIESVGENAFVGCKQIKSVDMSASSLRSLPRKLFFDCTYLEQVVLPESLTQLGDSIFAYTRLASVNVPSGVTEIPDGCFMGCYGLSHIDLPPRTVSIGDFSFMGCYGLSHIDLPSQIVSIGDFSFKGSGIVSMTFPSTVRRLGKGCIQDCIELTDFQYPENITDMDRAFFEGCISLKRVGLPSGMTRLPVGAFRNTKIETIDLPENLESIGDSCFFNCTRLTEITFPETLAEIGKGAFKKSALKGVTIPASIDTIRNSAFSGCADLSQVSLPEELELIEEWAFNGCSSLQKIILPDSVKLGMYAFSNTGLKIFTVPGGNENVARGLLAGCEDLEVVFIPSDVKKVGYSFLKNCVNLRKVYLQAPVPPETEVYEDYRYGRLGYELYATYEPFTGVPKSCVLCVPQESFYDYWNRGGLWKKSFTLEGVDFSGVEQSKNLFKIITGNGGITISLDRDMPIAIYDLQGRLVSRIKGVVGDNVLPLDKGVYIVCCGTFREKVMCQ